MFTQITLGLYLSLSLSAAIANDIEWKKTDDGIINNHAQYEFIKDNSIILKTSNISNIPIKEFDVLSDDQLLQQAFKGKEFSDLIYENSNIATQSTSVDRLDNSVELSKIESFLNSDNKSFFRLNKVVLKDNSFRNIEIIWPKEKDELFKSTILSKLEKINEL